MPEARWTVHVEGDFIDLIDPHGYDVTEQDLRLRPDDFMALVAAVRDAARIPELETDAETLRQARDLADIIRPTQVYSRTSLIADLLDLLSSPAPQGEGT